MALTGYSGVDVAIEAVGLPESFDTCQRIVAAGGHTRTSVSMGNLCN